MCAHLIFDLKLCMRNLFSSSLYSKTTKCDTNYIYDQGIFCYVTVYRWKVNVIIYKSIEKFYVMQLNYFAFKYRTYILLLQDQSDHMCRVLLAQQFFFFIYFSLWHTWKHLNYSKTGNIIYVYPIQCPFAEPGVLSLFIRNIKMSTVLSTQLLIMQSFTGSLI